MDRQPPTAAALSPLDGQPMPPSADGPSPEAHEAIVESLAAGDFGVLDLLAREYGARIHGYVRRIVGDSAAAEDVTHDVLVRAFEQGAECRDAAAFPVWLFRIARNMALDRRRKEASYLRVLQRSLTRGPRSAPPVETALEGLERREFRRQFEAAVASLPEVFRSAFVLREIEGLSYEQIADVLDTTPKTVSTRLHRARARLRTRLARYLDSDDLPDGAPEEDES